MTATGSERHQSAAAGAWSGVSSRSGARRGKAETGPGRSAAPRRGRQEGRVSAGPPASRPQPVPKRSPARPPASAFLLPPFTRNLSPARLHPDASLGGESPRRFPASLLPCSLSSQTPLFFSWTGSHPLLSPSFQLRIPSPSFSRLPAPQSLSLAEGLRLPSSLSLPRVLPILAPFSVLGCRLFPSPFPGLEFQTFSSPGVLPGSLSFFPNLEF